MKTDILSGLVVEYMSEENEFERAGTISLKMGLSKPRSMERHAGDVLVVSSSLLI